MVSDRASISIVIEKELLHVLFRLIYLQTSFAQWLDHAHFDYEYLVIGDREILLLTSNRNYYMLFRLTNLQLALTHSKGWMSRSCTLRHRKSRKWWQIGKKLPLTSERNYCMLFRPTYLQLTLTHSKVWRSRSCTFLQHLENGDKCVF